MFCYKTSLSLFGQYLFLWLNLYAAFWNTLDEILVPWDEHELLGNVTPNFVFWLTYPK
jgi:hypothetical protein